MAPRKLGRISLADSVLRTAVVSSSRNCRAILEAAGIGELFDARVDGTDLARLELAGKPAPDMFAEVCRRLGSDPQRTVGIEDAPAGLAAAKAAGYGHMVGVNRGGRAEASRAHGADRVLGDLDELCFGDHRGGARPTRALPSALEHLEEIAPGGDQAPALFLDYDGTLTPIVSHPDKAVLSDTMHATLHRLAGLCELAVVSGRDLADVRARVGLAGIWYAGSHGFDLAGPEGERTEYQEGSDYLPELGAAEHSLRERLGGVRGCLVERKRFSVAIHYRRVAEAEVAGIERVVGETRSAHPRLRLARGKKIFELQPDIDWDKGKALVWLMQTLDMDLGRFVPVYIGDDVTDEDAFRELEATGVGILVAEQPQPTRAKFRLANPEAVQVFLDRLADALEGTGR